MADLFRHGDDFIQRTENYHKFANAKHNAKKVHGKELEMVRLRIDLAHLNWIFLKLESSLATRCAIEYFENRCLEPCINKRQMYQKYVKNTAELEKLTNWNFDESIFVAAAINLYKRISYKKAHL